jgi:hypothetical protein
MIHFLIGNGKNCTCYDCSVLYGGECYSTPDNNFLDKVEKITNLYRSKTYICRSDTNKFLEQIKPIVIKHLNIKAVGALANKIYERSRKTHESNITRR